MTTGVGDGTAADVAGRTPWVGDDPALPDEADGLALNMAARSSAGDWLLAHLSSSTAVTIKQDGFPADGTIVALWVDPMAGARTKVGPVPRGGSRDFSTPPGWADAVLLFERRVGR